jgi:hypothetical protein
MDKCVVAVILRLASVVGSRVHTHTCVIFCGWERVFVRSWYEFYGFTLQVQVMSHTSSQLTLLITLLVLFNLPRCLALK